LRVLPKFDIQDRHRQILGYISKNRNRLIIAGICSLMISAATTAFGYLVKPVIDDIFIHQDTKRLFLLPFFLTVVFLARGVGRYGQEYYLNYVGEDIIRRLRDRLYDRIQDLPIAFFQKERTGVLMSRITSDVNTLKAMVSTVVNGALRDTFTVIGLTGVIFYQNWRMAIIAFIILPAAYYPIFKIGRKVRRVRTRYQEAMAEMNAFLHETLAGNKIVKAFGMETHEKRRFFGKTNDLFGLEIKAVRIRSLVSPIMEVLGGIGISLVIWYGGWEVIKGVTTPGTFSSFLTCVMLLYEPIKKLSVLNNAVQEGLAAVDRIFEVIEARSNIQDPENPETMQTGGHTLSFDKVYFRYADAPVLNGIDIEIPKGQILALVGTSGGGKSTIANLIPRFFDVDQGRVAIDGIDIRQFRVADLRREVAIVTQDPILFNETVRANIAYGNPAAPQEAIEQAARAAYAHEFIQEFSKGYDTTIGELGGRLSGGEKQRLCIARALLKNTPILILDEATSSLDSESEALVQKALENLMRGRTTLVIAHRLSTVVNADRIAVVARGRIVEQGTHETLITLGGEYAKLFEMQFGTNNEALTANGERP
jgi:ATP-binding cassette, subfamily B, bacterial MsbA